MLSGITTLHSTTLRRAVAFLVCGAFVVAGCAKPADKAEVPTTPGATSSGKPGGGKPDAAAKAVTLKPADPAELQKVLDGFKDEKKVVLVDFWATWCGPCKEGFPHTVDVAGKYAKDGLAVVAVALEEDPKETEGAVKEFLTQQNAGGLTALLSTIGGEKSFDAFEIGETGIPHYRLYGRDGTLIRKFVKGDPEMKYTDADMDREIRTALGLSEEPAAK